MNITKLVVDFAVTSAIVLVVSIIVTFIYTLITHGSGIIEWETSIRFAIILGVVLPLIRHLEKKQKEK
jgi:hypothetical protein